MLQCGRSSMGAKEDNEKRWYAFLDAWEEAYQRDPTLDPETFGREYKEEQ